MCTEVNRELFVGKDPVAIRGKPNREEKVFVWL